MNTTRIGIAMLIAALSAGVARGAGADPFLGTWTLNLKASRYIAGSAPQEMVITMESVPEGVRYRSTSTRADHRITTAEYVAGYDGGVALVTGDSGMLAPVTVKRIDSMTVDVAYFSGFQVIASSRRVLTRNGRTMTIKTSFKGKDGKPLTNIGVYERSGD